MPDGERGSDGAGGPEAGHERADAGGVDEGDVHQVDHDLPGPELGDGVDQQLPQRLLDGEVEFAPQIDHDGPVRIDTTVHQRLAHRATSQAT